MEARKTSILRWLLQHLACIVGAIGLTLMFFLVLPVVQAISKPPEKIVDLTEMDTGSLEAPEAPEEPEIEEEEPEPEEEPPPEMMEEIEPLSLDQLEMALGPGGLGDGWMQGDFAMDLGKLVQNQDLDDLDLQISEEPQATHKVAPIYSGKMKQRGGGTVWIKFIVDERGRVQSPKIQSSPDPIYERPALNALKQWRFKPAKASGKAVAWPMRLPITFPKG